MYANEHGVVGSSLLLSSILLSQRLFPENIVSLILFFIVGSILSFLSHFPVDYLNEYHYKNKGGWAKAQAYSYVIFFVCMSYLFFKGFILYSITMTAGYFLANMPDFIDKSIKGIKKARDPKDRFSSHNGESRILRFGKIKVGYPTLISFNKKQQTIAQIIATTIIVLTTYFISK